MNAPDFLSRLDPEIALLVKDLPVVDVSDVDAARAMMTARAAMTQGDAQGRSDVTKHDVIVPGSDGAHEVRVRVYRPAGDSSVLPCLYWIHGGGYMMGSIEHDDLFVREIVHSLGCTAVAVEWRHAPEHPYPSSLDDCYDGLVWLSRNYESVGVDIDRVAIGGASSGGGSAAGLTLLARDRGEIPICFQLLIYPMLDDRNVTPASFAITDPRVWNRASNLKAWGYYLAGLDQGDAPPPYAAPSRAEDLAGLPPTFISVGALDLFVDEDVEYAQRLIRAGVSTELHVYPGAPHGMMRMAPYAAVARQFAADRDDALRRGLGLPIRPPDH